MKGGLLVTILFIAMHKRFRVKPLESKRVRGKCHHVDLRGVDVIGESYSIP